MIALSPDQDNVRDISRFPNLFLTGPFGTGKTTSGIERVKKLLIDGEPANSILILAPQRTILNPYSQALQDEPQGLSVNFLTIGGLAQRCVDLFWPTFSNQAGFGKPDELPKFLTMETAQYFMAQVVRPLLEQGYFDSVVIDRNRLYGQIIDNLNKAAVVGFDHRQIQDRLVSAWAGEPAQKHVFADVQDCASRFRAYCLEHNLLDFSLQIEVFWTYLWPSSMVKAYLKNSFQHLVYENIEEDFPRAHDLVLDSADGFSSKLMIHDQGGGFRQFLGADPQSALRLRSLCSQEIGLKSSFVMTPGIQGLETVVQDQFSHLAVKREDQARKFTSLPIRFPEQAHFFPQMLDWVAKTIERLVKEEQVPASQIAVLSPYLSDALRFLLVERLDSLGISARTHRPSRSLRDEPATRALICLAALANPSFGIIPNLYDVAFTLQFCLSGCDLVRAFLLTEQVYHPEGLRLEEFSQVDNNLQERFTYALGERYERLRVWITDYRSEAPLPLDHFFRRLFGELLSQPGFEFHQNLDSARVTASLIESIKKFRLVMTPSIGDPISDELLGREYFRMIDDGILAAQDLKAWSVEADNAVLVLPAYTFLLMNQPVDWQIWLDPGSTGWSERLNQPLTQPQILNRNWFFEPDGKNHLWTDANEEKSNQESLARLILGLLRRCRKGLYLGISDLNDSGFEQNGALLKIFQRVFQRYTP